jgi:hypothetical protein
VLQKSQKLAVRYYKGQTNNCALVTGGHRAAPVAVCNQNVTLNWALTDLGSTKCVPAQVDWQATPKDAFHLNLFLSRSWFQIPNQFAQQAAGQDQHQLNRGFDVSGFWTRFINDNTLLSVNPYVRQDRLQYFPSADPFHDSSLHSSMSPRRWPSSSIRRGYCNKRSRSFEHNVLQTRLVDGFSATKK